MLTDVQTLFLGTPLAPLRKELKEWLRAHGVPHADCFEKGDLARKAQEHLAKVSQRIRSTYK